MVQVSYGEGTIDHFLGVLTPQSPSKWANLVWRVCATENPMDLDSRRETHPPFEPFPSASGLIAFGQSDNGDVLYWRTVGAPVDHQIQALQREASLTDSMAEHVTALERSPARFKFALAAQGPPTDDRAISGAESSLLNKDWLPGFSAGQSMP